MRKGTGHEGHSLIADTKEIRWPSFSLSMVVLSVVRWTHHITECQAAMSRPNDTWSLDFNVLEQTHIPTYTVKKTPPAPQIGVKRGEPEHPI